MRIFKWFRNLCIGGIIVFLLLLASGLVYEKSAEYLDSRKYTPPGKIAEINGHKMHIYTEGSGDSTVVFASGFGIPCPYTDFYPLYSKISKHAKIAVYDRPGYGWSEVSGTPRDIDTIAGELHELLEKSGEKPPYVLVGHSLASLEIIRFAQLYKDEVKGIVTIDAGNPEFYAKETLSDGALSSLRLKSILNKLGVFRLLFNHSPDFYSAAYTPRNHLKLVPEELRELDKVMYLKNMINKNKIDENNNMKVNAETVVKAGKLQNIPLRILTSEAEAKDEKWRRSQEAFKDWSSDSTQKIIKGTNHNMHQYIPDQIIEEILSLIPVVTKEANKIEVIESDKISGWKKLKARVSLSQLAEHGSQPMDDHKMFGFSIHFPGSWTLHSSVFHDGNNEKIAEIPPPVLRKSEQEPMFLDYNPETYQGEELISKEEIRIDPYKGSKIVTKISTESGSWYPHIYRLTDGTQGFTIFLYSEVINKEDQALFDRIVNTFRIEQ